MALSRASGVRRSWETQATSSRRDCSSLRSRCRDASSFAAAAASSWDRAASSAAIGTAGERNPPGSWPMDRAAYRSARLPVSTCRPSSQQNPNAAMPATTQTMTTTPRSCREMNIVSAVPSVPATIASTARALPA